MELQKLVLEELNLYFNNYKLGIERVQKYMKIQKSISGFIYNKFNKNGCYGSNIFTCCWGTKNMQGNFSHQQKFIFQNEKTGIEVLKIVEDKRRLGKGFTIKKLKETCKENKLKKYSKLDKLQLINLLMSI
tara:strand:- start:113 stop:505 length:393 start_codon:yes stop_codon:yes gene_type:complete